MKKLEALMTATALVGLALAASGCDAFGGLFGAPQRTTVMLRNNGDFPVDVKLFFGDDQETLDGVIQLTGTERNFVIAAGETESFSEPCDDLQAVIIDDADLQVVGSVGPEDRSDLLRDGSDFHCGDTVVFTFDHSILVVDFEIQATTQTP